MTYKEDFVNLPLTVIGGVVLIWGVALIVGVFAALVFFAIFPGVE